MHLTLAITWPQNALAEEDSLVEAAQVNGSAREELLSIMFGNVKNIGCGFTGIFVRYTFWMSRQYQNTWVMNKSYAGTTMGRWYPVTGLSTI